MKVNLKTILIISLFSLIPTFLIWLPFFLRTPSFWGIPIPQNGMATVVANYDGPLYIVVAKTLYDNALISGSFQFPLPSEYYAAHFPLFPFLIRLFGVVINYPYAMLVVTLLSSILALYFFYRLMSTIDKKNALFLTFLFSIFPARFLIVRSVGAADPLFVAAIIASVFYFKEKKYWHSGIWGMVAQFTKSAGILLFVAYIIYLISRTDLVKRIRLSAFSHLKKAYPILLIPTALLAVFGLYGYLMGDFFAYFNSGDNIHLGFPPFQIFNYSAPWVGTSWLEEIIFIYLFGILGVLRLFKMKEFEIATFAGVFFFFILFVSHRDILRYSLPVVPFLIVAFSDVLVKKEFRTVLFILMIPIYLFSLSFISQNAMPISNWGPFL